MNAKDIRVLLSNCEHSHDGLFRVHLTEADYAALLAENEKLQRELAERRDSPKPVVESDDEDIDTAGFWRDEIHRKSIDGCELHIQRCGSETWYWSATRHSDVKNLGKGSAPTLALAKIAAMKALKAGVAK